jgi:hypothetical protein
MLLVKLLDQKKDFYVGELCKKSCFFKHAAA